MKLEEYARVYLDNHDQTCKVAALMMATGRDDLSKRAKRMQGCGTMINGYECKVCGEYHVKRTSLCRDRLCPNCNYVLSKRRADQTYKALLDIHKETPLRVSMLTLTLRHDRQSDLKEMLRMLSVKYGKLVKQNTPRILGTARSIEITYGDNGFHPHIHALIAEDKAAEPITEAQIRREWRELLQADYDPQVKLEEAYTKDGRDEWESATTEAVKYSIKPKWMAGLDSDTLAEAADGMAGARLVTTDGAIRRRLHARERLEHTNGCTVCYCEDPQRHVYLRYNDGVLEATEHMAILGKGHKNEYV